MNIKINFKQGMRRIVLAFIGFCFICALGIYITNGCIFDRYVYVDNMLVTSAKTGRTVKLEEYLNIINTGEHINSWNISCHPYKQYCEYNDWQYRKNGVIKYDDVTLNISAPHPIQYLLYQIWDFIKIFLFAALLYGIYLLLELVFCWIIKGFKTDKE